MSVCLDDSDLFTAQVVCKELGCGTALGVYNMSSTANETRKYKLSCQEGETHFDECLQLDGCPTSSEDAALKCSGKMLFIISQHLGGSEIFFCLANCQ